MNTERSKLESPIAALKSQRDTLGDAVLEMATAPLRARLASLLRPVGMSVDWARTSKTLYLEALTRELEDPRGQHLDANPFLDAPLPRERWLQSAADLPGLGGIRTPMDAAVQYADPDVAERYRSYEERRGYRLDESDEQGTTKGTA